MPRRPSMLAAAVSLVLCAATCVLWVRSYRTPADRIAGRDMLNFTRSDPRYWVISGPGHLTLCRQAGRNWDHDLTEYHLLGARFGGHWGTDGSLLWNLDVPYWMLAAATGSPLLLGARRWRAWRRGRRSARLGLCPACGYDLRATPVAGGALLGRCPECGTRAPQVDRAAAGGG